MNSETKALLIIDLQKGFDPSDEIQQEILSIAPTYDVVVATKFENGNPLFRSVRNCDDLTAEEMELCELPATATVFKKTGFGLPVEVIEYLKHNGVMTVDVVGYQTEACVLACVFQLWDAEITPVVLEHLVGTREKYQHHHERALAIMRRNFGTHS